MKFVKWLSALLFTAILLEAAYCLLLLYGYVDAPTQIDNVLHDTFYTRTSASYFLKFAAITVVGALIGLWTARRLNWANSCLRLSGWFAVIGALSSLVAINWMYIKPFIIDDLPRRMPDIEEWTSAQTIASFMYQLMVAGNCVIILSALLLITGILRQYKARQRV